MSTQRMNADTRDVDAEMNAGASPPSARVALDRERIVGAALSYIDEEGLPGLSMRRLGAQLGVEAMSLYRYVPGKDDLLDAVVQELTDSMLADDSVLTAPRDGWQDFLQRMAHGVRRMALNHPKAFPLLASRPPEAPWLRPPLRSMDWVEYFLAGLRAEGFADEAAVAGYRAFSSFLLGHLLLEVASHGADVGPLDGANEERAEDEVESDHPTVHRLRRLLSEDHAAAEFEEALEELLGRMSLIRQGKVPQ